MQKGSSLEGLDDGALARRVAAAGAAPGANFDQAAEAELCRRLAPRVRLYGLRHLRDRHAAADLVQQVLLLTLERLRAGEVREPERIASFVLGTSRMMVMEMRRGTRRREELLEKWASPAPVGVTNKSKWAPASAGVTYGAGVTWAPAFAGVTDSAGVTYEAPEPFVLDLARLAGCLEGLSERERSVIVQTFYAEQPAEAVGAGLGIAAGNVRVIRHRALKRLRECMGAEGENP